MGWHCGYGWLGADGAVLGFLLDLLYQSFEREEVCSSRIRDLLRVNDEKYSKEMNSLLGREWEAGLQEDVDEHGVALGGGDPVMASSIAS